jgi:hypothetical protein
MTLLVNWQQIPNVKRKLYPQQENRVHITLTLTQGQAGCGGGGGWMVND